MPVDVRVEAEIFETVATEDLILDFADGSWATIIVRPPGVGWVVADAHRKRHTVWRRPVISKAGRGGGWRLP
jgi:hypothetical protein